MSNPNTIARPEIAERLGISITKLINIIRYTDANVPEPLGMEGKQLAYDREITLAWIATEPLRNITWQQRPKKLSVAEKTAEQTRAFLSGDLGLSKAQRNRNQLRKVIAKHRGAKTDRVEVSGSDDFHGTRDAWAGLV
jgi:hypothetical protein